MSSHAAESLRISSAGRKVTAWWKRMEGARFLKWWCLLPGDRNRRGEGHGDVLHPVDEVGAEPLHLTVQPYVGYAVEQAVSYTHLRAHETVLDLVCRLL